MNIVYGVSGEGLGHVFEAIEIIDLLQRDGHTVKVLTFGDRALECLARFNPVVIEGIHLVVDAKGLSLPKTFERNKPFFAFFARHTRRLLRDLAEFRPDVFISGYEPFTTLAANWLRRPLICMDNQNELRLLPRPKGASLSAFYLVCAANRIVTFGAAYCIIKSLRRPEVPNPRLRVVSPIVQQEIRRLNPTEGKHVLVYLTKPNEQVIATLKAIPSETFIVYCHDRSGADANITFRPRGLQFLEDLASCRAVIGTAGFSLIADSIYLRKPYFAVPLKRQFEQIHNASFLTDAGVGESSEAISCEQIESFLRRLPEYRSRLGRYHFDPAEQEHALREILRRLAPAAPPESSPPLTAPFLET